MKAKITAMMALAAIMVLGAVSCSPEPTPTPVPPLNPGFQGKLVEVSYDDFMAKKNITQQIELANGQSLVVSLASSPSTGFAWAEKANISDPAVISQYEHNTVAAQSNMPGAPAKDVWTFKPLKTGTAIISMSYSRPWQGGEQNEWTFTLNVTVK